MTRNLSGIHSTLKLAPATTPRVIFSRVGAATCYCPLPGVALVPPTKAIHGARPEWISFSGSHSPLACSWDLRWLLCSFTALLKLELSYGSWFGCTGQVAKLINFESSTSGPPSGLGHLNHGAFQGCLGLPNVNHHFTDHFCVSQNGKPDQHFVVKIHWIGSPGSWFLVSVNL